MPDIYFNSETGVAADIHKALNCIVRAVDCLQRLEKSISPDYLIESGVTITSFPMFIDSSGSIQYIQRIFQIAKGKDVDYLHYIVEKFKKSKLFIPNIESDWIVETIGTSSNLLHYVALNQGMILTFASDRIWEIDFIIFTSHEEKIPNIWGQKDITDLLSWLKNRPNKRNSYLDELQRLYHVIICGSCVENINFNNQDWGIIFDKFRLAEQRRFIPDGDLIKKMGDSKAGALCELIVTGNLRLFFVNQDGQILVGAKYFKGHGDDHTAQNKAVKMATQRINAYYFRNQQKV
jgi:hypothetical protein